MNINDEGRYFNGIVRRMRADRDASRAQRESKSWVD
jgi:hypothetical protein